jgi:pimeloyl-ACP methyl ester carboxylesterase
MPNLTPYAERGNPDGVPVVLLHGYSDSHLSYEPLMGHLPRELHVFAPTTRGHGDAEHVTAGYAPADLADDVVALMDAVGIREAVIVGHSAGTYTAQQLAVDHPERVLGLVLIGAFLSGPDHPVLAEMAPVVDALTDPVDPDFVREFQESTLAQPIPSAFLETAIAESLKLPAAVWRAALDGMRTSPAPTAAGTIGAPTMLIWGDRDDICPLEEQSHLCAAIPDAELVVYRGAGHATHWEQPHRVAADIAAFAHRVSPRGPRRPRSAAAR